MDALPHELIDHISSYLGLEDLRNTLFLSASFSVAAEKHSGAFDDFELNEENANRFLDIYGGHRFRFLKHISFRTTLPRLEKEVDWSVGPPACRDSKEELREADECFTKQIRFLFSTVKALETRSADGEKGPSKIKLTLYVPTRKIDPTIYCEHRLYVSWRIHLLQPELLPHIASISALRIENGIDYTQVHRLELCSQRKIDLRIITDIASRMTNLNNLECNIGGDEWYACQKDFPLRFATHDWAGPRRDTRRDFAQSLETTATSLLLVKDVRLDFIATLSGATTFAQREQFPNLIVPMLVDPLSSSLRLFSYRLRRLCLRAIVDHTLFWPSSDREAAPFWPQLEVLDVSFQIMTPSGQWYFKSWQHNDGSTDGFIIDETSYPPDAGVELPLDVEYHEHIDEYDWDDSVFGVCRVLPNEETLVPLLTSFAKAAAHMPRLKSAMLWAPLQLGGWAELDNEDQTLEVFEPRIAGLTQHIRWGASYCEPLAWGMVYAAPGTPGFSDQRFRCSDVRQIWWKVAKWRPEYNLHRMFKSIGRDVHGPELLEYWENERDGDGIAERDVFLCHEKDLFPDTLPYPCPLSRSGEPFKW